MIVLAAGLVGGAYLVVGWALLGLPSAPGRGLAGLLRALVAGFAVTPLALGWLALMCGGNVGLAGLALTGLAVLVAWRRHRRGGPDASAAFPLPTSAGRILLLGVAFAVAVNASYLAWMLGLRDGSGQYLLGTSVFDFEKHVAMVSALAAYGFPPQHPMAPGVTLLYYLGFYMAPAAVATLWPAALLPALVSQFLWAAVVVTCLVAMSASALEPFGRSRPFLTAALVLGGLSLGAGFPGLAATEQDSFSWPLWHPPLHIEPVANLFIWLPHHAVAIGFAVFALLRREALDRGRRGEWWIVMVVSGAVLACSAFVGLLFLSAVAIPAVLALLRPRRRPPGALARDQEQRAGPRRFGAAVMAAGVLALPFYWRPALAWASRDAPTASALQLTEAASYNLGTVLATCGAGVLAIVLFPLAARRPFARALRPVWVFGSVALLAAVAASPVSELQFVALYALQVALPFLLWQLLALSPPPRPAVARAAVVALACLAAWSASYGLVQTYATWRAAPRGSGQEAALVEWVQRHTPRDAVVDTLTLLQASFDYRFGRIGAESGVGAFSRLQDRWGRVSEFRRYASLHTPGLEGLTICDYLLVPRFPIRYFSRPAMPPSARALPVLRDLGFVVEMDNAAGTVLRRAGQVLQVPSPTLVGLEGTEPLTAEARRLLLEDKEVALAEQVLDGVMQAPDAPAEAAYLLAFALQAGRRDPRRALSLYEHALEAGYSEFWVRYNRGALQLQLGDRRAACADLLRAHELDPTHAGVGFFLGRLDWCRAAR